MFPMSRQDLSWKALASNVELVCVGRGGDSGWGLTCERPVKSLDLLKD